MSALIGARVARLEDFSLLTGGARFVDDIPAPGALHAAFVRSPHPHALIRGIDAGAARAMPGVVAVLALDDLAPVLRQRRMVRVSNSGTKLDQSWPFALADGEVSFVGEPVAIVVAERPLYRRGCHSACRGRLRHAAGGDRLPGRACAAGAPRTGDEPGHRLQGRLRRQRRGVRQGRPCRARGPLGASRRRAFHGRPRHPGANLRPRDASLGLDAKGPRSEERAGRLYRSRRKPAARRHARRRRRLWPETVRLSRGRRHGRRRDLAAPFGQMDRGPPRAFHQCGAGARSVLGNRDRRRRRRQGARHSRPADPRHRRLRAARRQHPVQFRDHAERPLYGAGAGDGRDRDPHQQGAGLLGARRRLSASGLRHGAADGQPGARDGHRARRIAPPQSDPGGEDAVSQAAQGALRRAGAIRQRRLSRLPGGYSARHGVGRFSAPPSRSPRAWPLYRHRAGARHQGHRPRPVRIRRRKNFADRTHHGFDRRRGDGARARHGAGANLRRGVRRARGRSHGRCRRYRPPRRSASAASPAGKR